MQFSHTQKTILAICAGIVFCVGLFIILPDFLSDHYTKDKLPLALALPKSEATTTAVFVASHIATPEPVKGVYITSWTASSKSLRDPIVNMIDSTELNTIVIDIKDYSGKIIFPVTDPKLAGYGSVDVRVGDMRDFIDALHKKGIYVVGRVAVFQDAYFVGHRPDLAVKNKAGTAVWKDRKGISWIDVGAKEYWDYILLLAKESYALGFDEINFDYIRFPSDGNMTDISFPYSSTTPKAEALRQFFEYIHTNLAGSGLKTSADLFGMTTTASDDMGIGQLLENALPYFDYICPMVYPSHYPATFIGYKNPAEHPYEVVHYAMAEAVRRAELASTTANKFRPWLQDFNLGANYGPAEVRAQIKATYDVGISSWFLWSASNKYTKSALEK